MDVRPLQALEYRGETQEEADYGSESFEEESEEEKEAAKTEEPPVEASKRGQEAPRSPSRPPLPRSEPSKKKKKRRSRSRSRGRRGGAKHQQAWRGLNDPNYRSHHTFKPEPIYLGHDAPYPRRRQ